MKPERMMMREPEADSEDKEFMGRKSRIRTRWLIRPRWSKLPRLADSEDRGGGKGLLVDSLWSHFGPYLSPARRSLPVLSRPLPLPPRTWALRWCVSPGSDIISHSHPQQVLQQVLCIIDSNHTYISMTSSLHPPPAAA